MDHTYKITEIVGSSPDGIDAAIRNGIARASKTLRNLDWFEVTDIRGAMNDGDIGWFQVTMKVGFRLDDGRLIERGELVVVVERFGVFTTIGVPHV